MYKSKHLKNNSRKGKFGKAGTLVLSLLLLVTVVVGGTIAYLVTNTAPIENKFTPSHVSCQVTETFNGTVKSNVNVNNASDIAAYIRVKLVTYRVNNAGEHIGGIATIPDFTPGINWVKHSDGYYYYTLPVAAGQMPDTALIGSNGISLKSSYDDADGGKQVIEVMAEAIQSVPAQAVQDAWSVSISEGSVTAYSAGN